jgi:hypothetical protein
LRLVSDGDEKLVNNAAEDILKRGCDNPKTRCKIRQRPLAALIVFNVGHATALTILGYVTAWCPCVFARRPERFAELTWAALPASLLAWAFPAVYMAICGSSTLRF